MKRFTLFLLFSIFSLLAVQAQDAETGLQGKVLDENNVPIEFATVALFKVADSTMAKAGYTEADGSFLFSYITPGSYYFNISMVGFDTYISSPIEITANNLSSAGEIQMATFATELGEVVVASTKPVIEVKPDKTVFNVEGSVNAIGNNALELLRKAPGVVVDNNERLMLLGKSGVIVYIDGKQSILKGEDLSNYLKSLQSTQIEAIELITQPSSRYEAEGNAGIINIRLIKDKSLGTNATFSLGHNQAIHGRTNSNLNVNSRTQKINLFGNVNYATGINTDENTFVRTTPDDYIDQNSTGYNEWDNFSLRGGFDVTTGKNSTAGFLFDGYRNMENWSSQVHTRISEDPVSPVTLLLEGSNSIETPRNSYNFNGNYKFDNHAGNILNVDVDYGIFENEGDSYQPNYYYDPETLELLDTRIFNALTDTRIELSSLKLDYEKPFWGGALGAGFKLALIKTDNDYTFYDVIDGNNVFNTEKSNQFDYSEMINAGYVNFSRQWEKISLQAGLRIEQTDSKGELTSYVPEDDETVDQEYLDYFPSGGVTYQLNPKHSFQLSYSRRIDRPNYQDLNPFEYKLDELTFQKGNPFLKPQYSNNFALSHTFNYTLSSTLSYSHTNDLMAQLTDTAGMGGAFITTENIADQDVLSLNVSYPFTITKSWNVFANAGVTNTHNKADFGDGKIIDIEATTFNFYAQNSFILPHEITIELSGWYNSPGIWGGNFATDDMFSIDLGVQKNIWKGRGNIKVGIADIFKSQGWSGENDFGGLALKASGDWESRQVKLNFTYLMGNKDLKGSRKRSTGIEDETKRIKTSN